jgi:hypothetical protein
MVALDFRRDESGDLPDGRVSSMIFVNVHVKGARQRHLLGQHRDERRVTGCDESRQHAKTASRQGGVELHQDVRAPDAGFHIGSDQIAVIELRREYKIVDKAYERVLFEILPRNDRRRRPQIRREA